MNVLIIAEVFHPDTIGGAGRVAVELAKNLVTLGCRVRVIGRATSSAPLLYEKRNGFEIYRYPFQISNPFSILRITKKGIQNALEEALSEFVPEVIDMHQPLSAYSILKNNLLNNIPAVYTFHSSWADELRIKGGKYALLSPFARAIETKVLEEVPQIVVLSEYSKNLVMNIIRNSKTEIIYGGVDLEKFNPVKSETKNQIPVILTVRNLVRRMGIENLIDAVKIIINRGRQIKLLIGGTGPLEKELRERAEAIRDNCTFLGKISEEELPSVYNRADLFVIPTIAIEGFGLVILEAFASGTPVVGTPVGAIPELLSLQGEEYVAAGTDAESLADAIENYFVRPDKISGQQLRMIAANYSWRLRAENVKKLYKKII